MTTSTNGRRITTHEATITMASIEIKTLTLSGKQMTLAVFRQLIEEALIDLETAELRGIPWGHINYHSGVGCVPMNVDGEGTGDHLHVVWQKGAELRRCLVLIDDYPSSQQFWQRDRIGHQLASEAGALRDRYDSATDSLQALDQLFIAV